LTQLHEEAGHQQNQQDREEVRDAAEHLESEERKPIEQERAQRLAPRTGVRKLAKGEGQPAVAEEQPESCKSSGHGVVHYGGRT
jgi:hypothetical protein